ncbi:MAG: S-layer homology domain-containing protein, partial [Clostridia bacterium]|nr:S-layer homology domain-containing protein [Clostridia bacterium]
MKRTILLVTAVILALVIVVPAAAVGPIVPNPDAVASRAVVIDALYQRDGSPEITERNDFADSDVQWYADAASWGKTNGIVFGDGDDNFHGERDITHAELAAMLWRYAQYKGVDVSAGEDTNILSYDDIFDCPSWSIPAFQWSVTIPIWEEGGMLLPNETLTCSEITHILENFTHGTALPSWTADAQAKAALIDYVVSATDPSMETFIPAEDRIAVFDLDGTLFCETDPNYFDYTL